MAKGRGGISSGTYGVGDPRVCTPNTSKVHETIALSPNDGSLAIVLGTLQVIGQVFGKLPHAGIEVDLVIHSSIKTGLGWICLGTPKIT